jgi:DNA-binding response OmpR family regulator
LLRFLFADHGYDVEAIEHPREIEAMMQRNTIDLIILKRPFPIGDVSLAQLRQHYPHTGIIIVGDITDLNTQVAVLENGADDLVAIPYEPAILLARVRAVLRRSRETLRDAQRVIVRVDDTSLDIGRLTFTTPSRTVSLTPTEMRLLECLMRASYTAVSRERLIAEVWGYESECADNRVDVYMRRLRLKIEAHPKDRDLISTVRGIGYTYRGSGRSQSQRANAAANADVTATTGMCLSIRSIMPQSARPPASRHVS